mgnify:CR=1 FL=1
MIGGPPAAFDAESVTIEGPGRHRIAGWFAAGEPDKPGVIRFSALECAVHNLRHGIVEFKAGGKRLTNLEQKRLFR